MSGSNSTSLITPFADRPLSETFTLPDLTPIKVEETKNQKIVVSIGPTSKSDRTSHPSDSKATNTYTNDKSHLEKDLKPIVEFIQLDRKASISLHKLLHQGAEDEINVWELKTLDENLPFEDIWSSLYAFWIRKDEFDRFPLHIGNKFNNQEKVHKYLTFTGLAVDAPQSKDHFEVILDKAAFWQGAGCPLDRSWMRSPQPHPKVVGDLLSTSFPYVRYFTDRVKDGQPHVFTQHPMRPPHPPPGALLYSRYIHSVGSHLQLTHIDPANKDHTDKYVEWTKDKKVSTEWVDERTDYNDKPEDNLKSKVDDPHLLCYFVTWDGEITAYGEIEWSKEDAYSTFLGETFGNYDQQIRNLFGKNDKRHLAQQSISSRHFCFLRDIRTEGVIETAPAGSYVVDTLKAVSSESTTKVVQLPKTKASVFKLDRDQFFTSTSFY